MRQEMENESRSEGSSHIGLTWFIKCGQTSAVFKENEVILLKLSQHK